MQEDEKVRKILTLLILYTMSTPFTVNAGLQELIQENVYDAEKSYEQIISTAEQPLMASQLWIHLRSDSQASLAEEIYKQIRTAGLPIDAFHLPT